MIIELIKRIYNSCTPELLNNEKLKSNIRKMARMLSSLCFNIWSLFERRNYKEGEPERSLICWFIPKIITTARTGLGSSQESDPGLRSLPPIPSPTQQHQAGSEELQPGLKQMPIWDFGTANRDLTRILPALPLLF